MEEEKEIDYFVSSFEVKDLWGHKSKKFNFKPSVNIIIGRNGSGKTAMISLLTKALKLDLFGMSQFEFSSVSFSIGKGKEKISIEITKDEGFSFEVSAVGNSLGDLAGSFKILLSLALPPFEFEMSKERRDVGKAKRREDQRKASRKRVNLLNFLDEKLCVSMLPTTRLVHPEDDEKIAPWEATIRTVEDGLVKYLAEKNSARNEALKKFQDSVLVLGGSKFPDLNTIKTLIERIDSNKTNLKQINKFLDLEQDFDFDAVEASLERIHDGAKMSIDDVLLVGDYLKLDGLGHDWLNTNAKIEKLFENWNSFRDALKAMFDNKFLDKSENNKLFFSVEGREEHQHEISRMSSGEKHLFVLLGEVLLRSENKQKMILIGDEPELSLHVEWQRQILQKIMGLSPACQIIVATHSPEIAGDYPKSINPI